MDWMEVLAAAINSAFVIIAVQALKVYVMPALKLKYPWLLPLIALFAGPAMAQLTEFLVAFTGYPIDLSKITEVLTGLAAVVMYSNIHAARKKMRARGG